MWLPLVDASSGDDERRAQPRRCFPVPFVRFVLQVPSIERELASGQVEELIEEAKGELILIPEYASWKYWTQKPVAPDDDEFSGLYEDLEAVDPESVEQYGLAELAKKKRAEAEARRAGAAQAPK